MFYNSSELCLVDWAVGTSLTLGNKLKRRRAKAGSLSQLGQTIINIATVTERGQHSKYLICKRFKMPDRSHAPHCQNLRPRFVYDAIKWLYYQCKILCPSMPATNFSLMLASSQENAQKSNSALRALCIVCTVPSQFPMHCACPLLSPCAHEGKISDCCCIHFQFGDMQIMWKLTHFHVQKVKIQ